MPYTSANDTSLPSYVKKLGMDNRRQWVKVFNTTFKKYGEEKAFIAANTWLKKKLKEKKITAHSTTAVERVSFVVDDTKGFIKHSDDGTSYIDFILTDNLKNRDGTQFPMNILQQWAEQINAGDTIVGDIDHEEYNKILSKAYTDNEIKSLLKSKRGIAKGIKAVIDKGKLWVRALIDKRYTKKIKDNAKGISLEALITKDPMTGEIVDGELLGFTFAVDTPPVNPRAAIA